MEFGVKVKPESKQNMQRLGDAEVGYPLTIKISIIVLCSISCSTQTVICRVFNWLKPKIIRTILKEKLIFFFPLSTSPLESKGSLAALAVHFQNFTCLDFF